MSNYDSGICEAHHKSAAKKPAENTQRRQCNFELQTAKRQIDSLSIQVAYQQTFQSKSEKKDIDVIENKTYKIKYCGISQSLVCLNQNDSKWVPLIQFTDMVFFNQLVSFCERMVTGGYLRPPLMFFSRNETN